MTLDAIAAWLRREPESMRTFVAFQRRCYGQIGEAGDDAAYLRLLGRMAGRWAEQHDGEPVAAQAVEEAHRHLLALTERALRASKRPAAEQLAVLNELARIELVGVAQPSLTPVRAVN
jgi:hypothetical protein